jgi:hypothetical protein
MTDQWLERTIDRLLDEASLAIAALDFPKAIDLVKTALKLDAADVRPVEILAIISGLEPVLDLGTDVSRQSVSTKHDAVAQPLVEPEIQPIDPGQVVDPIYEARDRVDDEALGEIQRVASDDWVISVDFGTSNTRVSIGSREKLPILLELQRAGSNPFLMPSVVALHRTDQAIAPVIGEQALSLQGSREWVVVRHIKRLIVASNPSEDSPVQRLMTPAVEHGFSALDDVANPVSAVEIAGMIVKEAIDRAQQFIDTNYSQLEVPHLDLKKLSFVGGVWATANAAARTSILSGYQSGRESEASDISLDVEPVLASRSMSRYDTTTSSGVRVFFDLGGGTFDVCVVHIEDQQPPTVLSADGIPLAGGADIERSVSRLLISKIAQTMGESVEDISVLISHDMTADMAVIEETRKLLEGMSNYLDNFEVKLIDFLGSGDLTIAFSEEELYDTIDNTQISDGIGGDVSLIAEIINCTKACIVRARNNVRPHGVRPVTQFDIILDENFVTDLIMVGGTSMNPQIEKAVRLEFVGIPVTNETSLDSAVHPLFAIVKGGAIKRDTPVTMIVDRPPFSVIYKQETVFEAYSSTAIHQLNQISSGITARKFHLPRPASEGSIVSLVTAEGDVVDSFELQNTELAAFVRYSRTGIFRIRKSDTEVIGVLSVPDELRLDWQIKLEEDIESDARADAQRRADDTHFYLGDNPK